MRAVARDRGAGSDADLASLASAAAACLEEECPGLTVLSSGVQELPFRGFYCDVTWTRPLLRGDLLALERRMTCRAPPQERFALVSVSPPFPRERGAAEERQRIAGLARESEVELRRALAVHDRASEHDHRLAGASLELFERRFPESGAVPWLPRGTVVHRVLAGLVARLLREDSYVEARGSLRDAARIYASVRRGAAELPVRLYELAPEPRTPDPLLRIDLRNSSAPVVDAAHAFLRPGQLEGELGAWLVRAQRLAGALGLPAALSFARGDEVARFLTENLYGELEHAGARARLVGTHRERELAYHTRSGRRARLVWLETSLSRSIESTLADVLEYTGGDLPPWLAPVQVRVLPVHRLAAGYAGSVRAAFERCGARADIDTRDESWENKVREALRDRVALLAVAGDREAAGGTIELRRREEPHVPARTGKLDAVALETATELRPPW